MNKLGRTMAILVSVLLLAFTSLAGHAASLPGRPAAQLPTWTPVDVTLTPLTPSPTIESPTPTPTPTTEPPSPTPTPTTEPPSPTPTSESSSPTPTSESPTVTSPAQPGPSATPRPSNTPRPEAPGQPAPNPVCQSMVEGYVLGTTGQRVAGATVTVEGPGWSSGIMTDDDGRYGFAGLCAGSATVRAFLASGQAGPVATVTFTGNNSLRQDLSFATSATAPAPATQASQGTAQPAPTGSAEAGMPVTGYAGWLLVGGAALAVLLLVSAGGRRALQAHEHARSRE